jgi:UDP-glucose 4-epimerase
VIVFGGTGAIGSCLLNNLVKNKKFSIITNVGRRNYDNIPKEVKQIVIKDFDKLDEDETLLNELKETNYDTGF